MSNQEKITYLKQYLLCQKEMERLVDEQQRLISIRDKITQSFSDMPKSNNAGKDKSDGIVAVMELQSCLETAIKEWVKLHEAISETIITVPNPKLQLLLRYRYIDDMTFEIISLILGYSLRQIHRMHKEALEILKIKKMS